MQRREFLTLIDGAATSPLAARAQQGERVRRISVLMNLAADDAEGQARLAAFLQGLQEAGWAVGRNVRIDLRWGAGDADDFRKQAAELVALAPDVVLASGIPVLAALLQATRTVPIVFAQVVDPVGAGLVATLARPGGNATGFTIFEYGLGGKWVELLKEIMPGVTRVAVLRDAASTSGIGQLGAIQVVASSFGMELTPVGLGDAGEIERAVAAFARTSNGGLIVTPSALAIVHRDLIITLAARHRLPAIYLPAVFPTAAACSLTGLTTLEPLPPRCRLRRSHSQGREAADLPVQAPTKFELVINLKTAKALGLTVPPTLLARADEIIE